MATTVTTAQVIGHIGTLVSNTVTNKEEAAALTEALTKLMTAVLGDSKPKTGSTQDNPEFTTSDGTIWQYCKWQDCYQPKEQIVQSNGASKNYSHAALSRWNKMNKEYKDGIKTARTLEALGMDMTDEVARLEELKDFKNQHAAHDVERDWTTYCAGRSPAWKGRIAEVKWAKDKAEAEAKYYSKD